MPKESGVYSSQAKSYEGENWASKYKAIGEKVYPLHRQETFDISSKTTTQQGIKLTPEIKAKIRGEAPKLKKSIFKTNQERRLP